jgi:hypothetical protein
LNSKVAEIAAARQIQESSPSGITLDKAAKRDAMTDAAMFVKGAVQAFATDNANNELFGSVNYSLSEIKRAADTIARDRALLIYNKAFPLLAKLADYGITAAVLTDFKTAIANFTAIIPKPRTAINSIKAATTSIEELFIEADIILKRKVDKFMVQFKASNVSFYNTYLNARQIIDLGKGSKTIEVILNPLQTKTVQRVINGSVLTNTGTTILIYCGDHLPPCDAGDESAVQILPGDSIKIDIKEHFVTLTNKDAVKQGTFTVKVTSEIPVVPTV